MSHPRGEGRTRVLFVSATLGGGGAERVLALLLGRLDRARFEPHLALVRRTGHHLGALPPDVPVHEVGGGRLPSAVLPLGRLVRRLRPDVVCATLMHVNIVTGCLLRLMRSPARLVLRETGLPSRNLARLDWPWLMRRLYRLAYTRADAVVCQGEHMRADVADRGVPPGRLVVVPNPVDAGATRAAADRAGNPYAPDGVHLVACGRLSWEKGPDLLLDAFAAVRRARGDVTLHLVGEGPEEGALRAQAARLGLSDAVRFHGFVPEPFGYLRHARLFVLASRFESFSNAVLEALACGTPVAAFDCPGDTGPLLRDTAGGTLAPPEDTGALARAILARLDGPAPDREAVAAAVRPFEPGPVVARYEALLAGGVS